MTKIQWVQKANTAPNDARWGGDLPFLACVQYDLETGTRPKRFWKLVCDEFSQPIDCVNVLSEEMYFIPESERAVLMADALLPMVDL
jgi:hypothetical protein